ncbi:hypothetical protein KP79_PYT24247 [Mizuhopecten yessoensis]|uniref:B box-type domain-containing protein n=1 Tax=Mizuhopecten yessoensis TaxID=6573 RepID=A0A210QRC2_MIZYE|nr:hypothetical protein KP79_PYT24247 [Mizuhopecten yessoensis]
MPTNMGNGSNSKSSVSSTSRQQSVSSVVCEPCQERGQDRPGTSVSFCIQCRQFCCQVCAENHRKFKGTQTHQHALFLTGSGPRRLNTNNFACERCTSTSGTDTHKAAVVCRECKQLLCQSCSVFHNNDVNQTSHTVLTLAAFAREPVSGANDIRRRQNNALPKTDVRRRQFTHDSGGRSQSENRPDITSGGGSGMLVASYRKTSQSISTTYRGEFSVGITSDKHTAKTYDISTMLDGKIIVIDDRNAKMKIFTPDHKLHSSLSFAYLPGNVTCVNENMIAMAMGNDILYFKLKATKLSQMTHKLSLKGDITGIVKNVNTLAVTYEMFGNRSKIGIINSNGSEKELNKSEEKSSTPMERWGRAAIFKSTRDASLNVVVLEDDSGTLGCYDTKGHRAWTCLIPQAGSWQGGMSTKMGGIVAVADVILVTDVINHVIHVVTERGEYSGVLLDQTDGLHRPNAICYNIKGRLLYITQFRSDVVKVFSIK